MAGDKILIIDDEQTFRWLLSEAVKGWGYEVTEAGTGAQALATLVAEQPAAVLLDINLPDCSGMDLLREIKCRRPGAAVVMVTAEAVLDNAVSALRGGADDFVSKPLNLEELRYILQRLVEPKPQGDGSVVDRKARLLIISDSAEQVPRIQSTFHLHDVEVTSVLFPEDWSYAAFGQHDLALVDVGPDLVEPILKNIRASNGQAAIPVLVEIGRMTAANNVSDIMTKYGAIACSRNAMVQFVQHYVTRLQVTMRKGTEREPAPATAE